MPKPLTNSELLSLTRLFFGYIPNKIKTKEIERIWNYFQKFRIELEHVDYYLLRRLYSGCIIDQSRGCWTKPDTKEYGRFFFHGKIVPSHRLSFRLMTKKWDQGLLVCHFCDNKPCINFFHLFQGTHQDNLQDYFLKHPKEKMEKKKKERKKREYIIIENSDGTRTYKFLDPV